MFTCSSCGYEANPDSAPACSLCGTKRPVKAGGKAEEAPKPAPAPAPAPASSSSPGSPASASSSSASASSTKAKSETRRPAAQRTDDLDELATAAKAVADSASNEPQMASGGARNRPAAGENKTVVTTTGILRMSAAAPPIDNALTLMGAFIGAVAAYAIEWHRVGAAPSSWLELVALAVAATGVALFSRFLVAPMLEDSLAYKTKVNLHGPVAGVTGAALAIFSIIGFVAAQRVNTAGTEVVSSADFDGIVLGQRLALMTPWTVTFKTDKFTVLSLKGKPELRVPCAPLTADDIATVIQKSGYTRADLERLMSGDPSSRTANALPPEFSVDTFLDRIATVYGVRKDSPRTMEKRTGTLLARRRRSGDELLALTPTPKKATDLGQALPQGVPIWIGVSLGIPHDSTSDHDAVTNAVYDQYRPAD